MERGLPTLDREHVRRSGPDYRSVHYDSAETRGGVVDGTGSYFPGKDEAASPFCRLLLSCSPGRNHVSVSDSDEACFGFASCYICRIQGSAPCICGQEASSLGSETVPCRWRTGSCRQGTNPCGWRTRPCGLGSGCLGVEPDPLSGEPAPFGEEQTYGCGTSPCEWRTRPCG